ncbi:unnamed protein product [Pleuronectes platessa]|uniref:Uncharacterized protein n=1 Tax=Pleuronectes platessa TaxID=8262 RepID=A0A9N7VCP2_PLEPL|nr:unnamed protein product [Pleuronectes platessa]
MKQRCRDISEVEEEEVEEEEEEEEEGTRHAIGSPAIALPSGRRSHPRLDRFEINGVAVAGVWHGGRTSSPEPRAWKLGSGHVRGIGHLRKRDHIRTAKPQNGGRKRSSPRWVYRERSGARRLDLSASGGKFTGKRRVLTWDPADSAPVTSASRLCSRGFTKQSHPAAFVIGQSKTWKKTATLTGLRPVPTGSLRSQEIRARPDPRLFILGLERSLTQGGGWVGGGFPSLSALGGVAHRRLGESTLSAAEADAQNNHKSHRGLRRGFSKLRGNDALSPESRSTMDRVN